MFVCKVIDALDRNDVPYTLVGGYALVLHGVVRGTVDIDIAISLNAEVFKRCESALQSIGLAPRLPVTAEELFHFREEYIARRNLKAWSFHNPANPLEVVDILITEDAEAIESVDKQAFGRHIHVAAVPELIAMKQKAGRPQDIEDIKALERLL
jgi:hypothetical protein